MEITNGYDGKSFFWLFSEQNICEDVKIVKKTFQKMHQRTANRNYIFFWKFNTSIQKIGMDSYVI